MDIWNDGGSATYPLDYEEGGVSAARNPSAGNSTAETRAAGYDENSSDTAISHTGALATGAAAVDLNYLMYDGIDDKECTVAYIGHGAANDNDPTMGTSVPWGLPKVLACGVVINSVAIMN